MLEEFKDIDTIVYRQLYNGLKKLSHAYLFNLNNNVYAEDMIMSFVKSIMCKYHTDKEEYNNCYVCKRIDDGNFPDLKIIYPDGMWIKKEQLDELQQTFSTKPIESLRRCYIIYEVDKLNKSAANSLLKFLEEPGENIVAILLTNNINAVLDTIRSRCQIITFSKNKVEDYITYNNIIKNKTLNKLCFTVFKINNQTDINEYHELFLNNVIKFIQYYEENGIKILMHIKEYFYDNFKEKEEILKFFDYLVLFYSDLLNYKIYKHVTYYDDYIKLIDAICNKNDTKKLINKINVILDKEKLVKSNANTNLLIDGMIIDMEA